MFNQFAKEVEERLQAHFETSGLDVQVRLNSVLKVNDINRQGIIMKPEESKVAPIIYLEEFYKDVQAGDKDMDGVIDELVSIYEENRAMRGQIHLENIFSFDQIKNELTLCVVNTAKNQEMLNEIPYVEMDDLSAFCRIPMINSEEQRGFMKVTYELLDAWNVDFNEVYDMAISNTHNFNDFRLYNMEDIIGEMMGNGAPQNLLNKEVHDNEGMFVLTNEPKVNGAAALLRPDIMEQVSAVLGGDYYILPSSLHETICIRKEGAPPAAELGEMVREINATQVDVEDRLSDHIYAYDSREKKIHSVRESFLPLKEHSL